MANLAFVSDFVMANLAFVSDFVMAHISKDMKKASYLMKVEGKFAFEWIAHFKFLSRL